MTLLDIKICIPSNTLNTYKAPAVFIDATTSSI